MTDIQDFIAEPKDCPKPSHGYSQAAFDIARNALNIEFINQVLGDFCVPKNRRCSPTSMSMNNDYHYCMKKALDALKGRFPDDLIDMVSNEDS